MAHTIYYDKNTLLNLKVKKITDEPAPQSSPYPKLLIQHSVLVSGISQYETDYDNSLYSYQVAPGTGEYEIELSSSIFANSDLFKFRLTADIADEVYFDVFEITKLTEPGPINRDIVINREIQQTSNFYKNNLKDFFPDVETDRIETNKKYKILMEAVANQMDKLDQMSENLVTLTRIDEIPEEYIRYLAQVVGYETSDFTINTIALRSIVREIFSIYNLRGTHKGFVQFFKSLGYNAKIQEKWYEGELAIVNEKPHVQKITQSDWQWSTLTGSELLRSEITETVLHGRLDLINDDNNDFQFVELFPTSVTDYSFSAKDEYREAGKFNKAERAVNLLLEPTTNMELAPNLIDQMVNYVAFLKPVHIKLILSLIKNFEDIWWKISADITGETEDVGNVPRNIDEIDFERVMEDNLIPDEGEEIGSTIFDNKDRYYFKELLYFNGKYTVGETDNAGWKWDGTIKEFLMNENVGMTVKYLDPSTLATTITQLDLNAKKPTFGDLTTL